MTRAGWRAWLFCLFCLSLPPLAARSAGDTDPLLLQKISLLERWEAGEVVPLEVAERFGMERCFASEGIDEAVLARIRGKSYKENAPVKVTDLRYVKVLHYTPRGEVCLGELICHREISGDLMDIFRVLFQARYPIERMVLIDEYDADDERSMRANNTSCFNFRPVAGTSVLSAHSRGLAIDINPRYNPYVKHANGRRVVRPAGSEPYADRTAPSPYSIHRDDLCYKEFKKRGFAWGGDWRSVKDYQHFEKRK